VTGTCFRCDWIGDTDAASCPECGAPLYRPASPGRRRRASFPSDRASLGSGVGSEAESPEPDDHRPLSEARPAPTSPRSVFAVVGTTFFVILVLLSQGGADPGRRRVEPTPSVRDGPAGFLIYSVQDGAGSSRLWRWDLATDEVRRGPMVPQPVELVNVRSPSYGWLAMTSDLGDGTFEAAVLDSLEVGAEPQPLGRGAIVTWARQGETALLVERGAMREGCRREVSVAAVHVDRPGRERVFDGTVCGDVLSVGRTTVGHFLTRQGPSGVDVIGTGYRDAGVLLPDHGLIAVSPGGDVLVTSSADLPTADAPSLQGGTGRDVTPIPVAGRASLYSQFTGPPVPYLVDGAPLRVDRVLAYSPGAEAALVVGRLGQDPPGIWELPLLAPGDGSSPPRLVGSDGGFTFAAYTNDGTAYVASGGHLFILREHVLQYLDAPEGAPTPAGPLAWVVQEPITDL
jgi:hypothetical protein